MYETRTTRENYRPTTWYLTRSIIKFIQILILRTFTITMVKLALLFLVCDGPVCQTSPASVLCSSRRKKAVQVRLITPNRLRVSGHMYVSPPNSTQDFLYNFNLTELTCETYGSLSLYLLE